MTPALRAAIEAANQTSDFDRDDIVRAVLAAATPVIRAEALEEAARVADGYFTDRTDDVAAGIRALKDKP